MEKILIFGKALVWRPRNDGRQFEVVC